MNESERCPYIESGGPRGQLHGLDMTGLETITRPRNVLPGERELDIPPSEEKYALLETGVR